MNHGTKVHHLDLLNIKTAIFLFIVILTTFYPVLENKFTNWDDPVYVTRNNDIRSLSPANIRRIFTSSCCAHYHPLTVLSLAAEFRIYKLFPFFYHADNLILHYCNCLLLLWLLFLITQNSWISFFAALLFAVHPMHVESVAWVSGRKDVLFTFFYLSSFISYIYYRRNDKPVCLALSVALFVLSMLSKESAVMLPLALIAYDYFIFGKIRLKDKAVFLVLALIFGVIAIYSQRASGAMITEGYFFSAHTLRNFLYSFFFYINKFIFPFKLSCFYNLPVFSADFLVETAMAASVLAVSFVLYNNKKEAVFALVFYFVNIILFLQLIPEGYGYAAVCDRYTYVPYVGFAMLVAGGIKGLIELNIKSGKYIIIAAMVFAAFFAFVASQRCKIWHDSYTLWSDAIKNNPLNDRAYANRGFAETEDGFNDAALVDFERSVELNFNIAKVHFEMGNIYFSRKQYDMAAESYLNAIKVDPSAPSSHFYLGLAYNLENKDNDAIDEFNAAARLDPNYTETYYALGNTYFKLGQYDKAVISFTEALKRSKEDYLLYNNRGYAYYMLGNYEKALIDLNKAVALNPNYDASRKHLDEALKARHTR